jgi:hypothetical protein
MAFRAFGQVVGIQVMVWALHQGIFGLDQRPLPLLWDGALLRVVMPIREAAQDELVQGWV